MNQRVHQFFRQASSFSLSQSERDSVRAELQRMIQYPHLHQTQASSPEDDAMLEAIRMEQSSLSVAEKDHGKEQLLLHMRSKPVALPPAEVQEQRSWWESFLLGIMPRTAMMTSFVALIGSTTVYAAQSSIPGDALYPLKVQVLEPALERLRAPSASSLAAWEVRLAERRLDEAHSLWEGGNLTMEEWQELEQRFEKHVDRSLQQMRFLQSDDAQPSLRSVRARLHDSVRRKDSFSADMHIFAKTGVSESDVLLLQEEGTDSGEQMEQRVPALIPQPAQMKKAFSETMESAATQAENLVDTMLPAAVDATVDAVEMRMETIVPTAEADEPPPSTPSDSPSENVPTVVPAVLPAGTELKKDDPSQHMDPESTSPLSSSSSSFSLSSSSSEARQSSSVSPALSPASVRSSPAASSLSSQPLLPIPLPKDIEVPLPNIGL